MSTSDPVRTGAALVTGASRGIGKVIALRLAERGYAVAINYRASAGEAEKIVREMECHGGRAIALQADMSDVRQASALYERAQDAFGPISVIVNNAGITRDRLLVQMSQEDWDATWLTDLAGPRALLQRAITGMPSTVAGRIVNLSSVVGSVGNAGQSNYAAAKSALLGLTREAAVQCASRGITVNCVVPGFFATDATSHLNQQQTDTWMQRIPARRFGDVEDIAELVMFLVSPAAGYITGQCIAIDGGFLAASGFGFAS